MTELVELERDDHGVRCLALNDPGRRNAMGGPLAEAVRAALAEVAADPRSRALVVTGRGSAFCAGADLPELFGDASVPVPERRAALGAYYRTFDQVRDLPIPTIAAINGPAVGAGLNLALACDHRIAAPDAALGATFARIGLHPGGGCAWMLVRLAGRSAALRILLLGETLDGRRALGEGLVDACADDPLAEALALARRYARVDADLARQIKQAVDLAAGRAGLAESAAYESWAQAVSAGSPALAAWVERFRRGT